MKKIIVLTGAGISAESGIKTFRDADGLWEGHDVMEVASPEGFSENPELVLEFYNIRRRQLLTVAPNPAHHALVDLEEKFDVHIVTQNVDDLHERAGSGKVLHLHGELLKSRSSQYPHLIYDCREDIRLGDKCEKGAQLRPNIVWFGEMVSAIEEATEICRTADLLMIIGTSMVVYPAAGLIHYVNYNVPKYIIDPKIPEAIINPHIHAFEENASTGVPKVVKMLMEDAYA